MSPRPIAYLLPDGLDLDGLRRLLAETHDLREGAREEIRQTYYDSFDWRVWQAGGELVLEENRSRVFCWVERGSGEPVDCLPLETLPSYSSSLPESPLRERLDAVLEMRVLMPQVSILQKHRILRLLDDEEKTVVRVLLQSNSYLSVDDDGLSGELDARVLLKPLKGYDVYFEKLREQMESLQLISTEQSIFEEALSNVGRKAGEYNSKLNYILDPDARSDFTAKKIMLSLLDTLQANVDGAKANLDSEFLHDLRVATRRTRSAMGQIKGVFEPKELAPFKRDFSWLGKVTGPTRDLDVYLLQFADYQASLPQAIQTDLEPFHDFLLKRQGQAQAVLEKELNSARFRKLIKRWRAWLQAPVPQQPKAPNALRSISALSDQRICKLYHKVMNEGGLICPDSPPEALHELRKECKKLRYMIEFFQSLYPKPEMRQLVKELKTLLDNLGEFQDLQVQAHSLEAFGEQMMKEGAPASALMAMGILVGKLLERQTQARQAFADLFAAFSSEKNRQIFNRLFGG